MPTPTLKQIYRLLHSHYGPQGWWPVTPPGKHRPVYSGGPKSPRQVFEVMVGAVLTQNTSWTNVERALQSLQAARALSRAAIARLPHTELAEMIRSSGYFNEKAKKLKALCQFLEANPPTKLAHLNLADLRAQLLSVHGIGPETADSIVLYAFGKPSFVVDAYTKRIFQRLGFLPEKPSYDETKALFEAALPAEVPLFNEYHALIVEHGKNVCRSRPKCEACVLRGQCRFRNILP